MDINPFMVRAALSGIAADHPDDCTCYICKAALGDEDAFARVLEDLEYINMEEPEHDSNRILN